MSGWLVLLLGVGIGWIGGVASTVLLAWRLARGRRVIHVPPEATKRQVQRVEGVLKAIVRERAILRQKLEQRTGLPESMFEPEGQIEIIIRSPVEPATTLATTERRAKAKPGAKE